MQHFFYFPSVMSWFAANECDNHMVKIAGSHSGEDAEDSGLLRCYEMWAGKQ